MLNKAEIAKRFGKQRLLGIAKELEITIDPSTHVYLLVDNIAKDLEENGIPIPEGTEEVDLSDDMFDILVAFEYIDEDGNVLEDSEKEGGTATEESQEEPRPSILPECWGWSDEADPACAGCKFLIQCVKIRRTKLKGLPCFGTYDSGSKDCTACIMWRICQKRNQ